ncbi:hypothetical protein [Cesiribacter sp. SM1]|uniref:hypothetical protein n=1 Tax=Cesiribacter sp. SM1 TaxID=2861196 RepID=UPI001CD6F705|nr:hypothetical protein [Cesiribacter sp. SM1]
MTYRSGFLAVYTALLMSLCFACENTERNPQTEGPAKNTLRDSVETEEVAVKVLAGDDTTLESNSLMNSMAPKWSVQEVLRKYPEAEITNKEAVPNRHTDGQIDTLITIKSDSTIFQFYSLQDRDLLQTATLSKAGIALGNGLEVGMTAEEVTNHIEPLQGRKAVPQSILIRAEQAPTSIRLRFRQNRLSYIDYQGYVD